MSPKQQRRPLPFLCIYPSSKCVVLTCLLLQDICGSRIVLGGNGPEAVAQVQTALFNSVQRCHRKRMEKDAKAKVVVPVRVAD